MAAGDISRIGTPDLGPARPRCPTATATRVDLDSRDGRNISTVQTFGTGNPDVVVNAHVGLGQILIGKE